MNAPLELKAAAERSERHPQSIEMVDKLAALTAVVDKLVYDYDAEIITAEVRISCRMSERFGAPRIHIADDELTVLPALGHMKREPIDHKSDCITVVVDGVEVFAHVERR